MYKPGEGEGRKYQNNTHPFICRRPLADVLFRGRLLFNQWRLNNAPHGSIARRTPEYLISNDNPRLVSRIDQYGTSIMIHRN